MKPGLLDVNFLIALLDPVHIHHDEAHEWYAANGHFGWATCPVTVNGCVRILSNPAYPSISASSEQVVNSLRQMCLSKAHRFWPDTTDLLNGDMVRPELIANSKMITDVCLLALARKNGGRLITFDRRIPFRAVVGALPEDICIVAGPPVTRHR